VDNFLLPYMHKHENKKCKDKFIKDRHNGCHSYPVKKDLPFVKGNYIGCTVIKKLPYRQSCRICSSEKDITTLAPVGNAFNML